MLYESCIKAVIDANIKGWQKVADCKMTIILRLHSLKVVFHTVKLVSPNSKNRQINKGGLQICKSFHLVKRGEVNLLFGSLMLFFLLTRNIKTCPL